MSWFFFAGTAALLLALAIIIEKKILFKERSMEFAVALASLNAVFSIPLLWQADFSRITLEVWGLIFAASLVAASSFFFVIRVNKHMEISESSPLLALAPAFVAIFALAFLGEKLTLMQTGGLALLIFGAFILESKHGKGLLYPFKAFINLKYGNLLLLSLVFYGIGSVMDRVVLAHYGVPPRTYLGIIQVFIAANFLVLAWVFHDGWQGLRRGIKDAGGLIVLVAILTVLHRWAYVEAVSEANIGLVAGIKRSSVLFVTLIGGEIFHDHGVGRKFLATVIMFTGIILLLQ